MINWILNIRQNGKVRYIMENGDYPVMSEISFYDLIRKLPQNAVRISDKFPGFPITTDDKYYYEGDFEEVEI